MTEPRDKHDDRDTEAATADPKLEVRPEVIKDLDVPADDADVMGGGITGHCCGENPTNGMNR